MTSNSTYTAAVHLLHMNNQSIDFQCHTVTHCTWCNSRLGHIPRLPQHTVCFKSWGGAWEWGYARPHQLDWSDWEMETTIPRNNQWDTAQGLQEKRHKVTTYGPCCCHQSARSLQSAPEDFCSTHYTHKDARMCVVISRISPGMCITSSIINLKTHTLTKSKALFETHILPCGLGKRLALV